MMPFTICKGHAATLMRDNIDTDQIIRIERIAQLKRGEFSHWLFETWRYLPDGTEDPRFVLNIEPYRAAPILIGGDNFGCGSSREMAVWAIQEFGIRCVIAPGFGDIFFNNCLQNGVLPIRLGRAQVEQLAAAAQLGDVLNVDLQACMVTSAATGEIPFSMLDTQRQSLLLGQDDVAQTLAANAQIDAFQKQDSDRRPWVYMAV